MNCPFCDFADLRMRVHRHLLETHLDRVVTEHDEATGKMKYVIACPVCGLRYQHAVKPRYRDAGFLDEFKGEIGLVAFDQLLYHLDEQHPIQAGRPDTADAAAATASDQSPP
ncbi:MAG: hypothetical protein IT317_14335 [Anaerolineales bacterium]|nr:hypothetical protein [Anaerolineales bacterium]